MRTSARALWDSWLGDTVLALILVASMVAVHLFIPGTVPSGGDGGNWLALAAERFGNGVMSAEVSYLPLFPTLLGLIEAIVGDGILAVVISSLVAKLVLVGAVYVCARPLGRGYAFVAALIVGFGGALLESYAWGGYPQLLAMGFGLMATFMVVGHLNTGRTAHLVWGLVFVAATLLTHTMVGGLLGISLAVAVVHLLYMTDPRSGERARSLRVGLGVAGAVLLVSGLIYVLGQDAGFEPTINPIGLNRLEAILATVRDAPYPWAIIAAAGISVLFFRYWPDFVAATIAVGSSWAAASMLLFLVTGEPRALLVTQVGLVLLAVLAFGAFKEFLKPSTAGAHRDRPTRSAWHALLLVAGVALTAAVVGGGLSFYDQATDWYRVVDHAEIDALDVLADVSDPDALVLAATGHHGNPVGWWVEGYAQRSTYTAVDTAFLAFPDEIEQSELAMAFFGGELGDEESLALLEEVGAEYLVVDKRGPEAFWLDTPLAATFDTVDDSSNIVILRTVTGE